MMKFVFSEVINAIPELDYICVDVANGYSEHFVEFVRLVRKEFPDKTIFVSDFKLFGNDRSILLQAGNVVTCEMVEELILSGADIVKCGIGPGSVCTTRLKTGVGYPQLSCILECADAAHGLGGHIVSVCHDFLTFNNRLKTYFIQDGGCTSPGDVAKAFGAGTNINESIVCIFEFQVRIL